MFSVNVVSILGPKVSSVELPQPLSPCCVFFEGTTNYEALSHVCILISSVPISLIRFSSRLPSKQLGEWIENDKSRSD